MIPSNFHKTDTVVDSSQVGFVLWVFFLGGEGEGEKKNPTWSMHERSENKRLWGGIRTSSFVTLGIFWRFQVVWFDDRNTALLYQ